MTNRKNWFFIKSRQQAELQAVIDTKSSKNQANAIARNNSKSSSQPLIYGDCHG